MKNIDICLISHFEDQDSMKKDLKGGYVLRETEARVMYAHELTQGEKPIPETVTVRVDSRGKPQWAEIHRPGSDFVLHFEKDSPAVTTLMTPAGKLDVELRTRRLDGLFTDSHFTLQLQYEMILGGQSHGMTRIEYTGTCR